jgi:uncharacterized iron-regulated protein
MRFGFGIIAILCAGGVAASAESAEPATVPAVVAAARAADIVVLGEVHDNPEHHRNQAAIVAALQPAALVFEMIPQADEDEVNELRAQGADRGAIAAALDWAESGWPDFGFYAEILEAAPDARVFGAGQPAADVRRAMVEGAAGVFGPDAGSYGLDEPLAPEELAAREALQDAAHCWKLPQDMLPGMVEAQRFRDAGLADAALWARTMTGNGKVVVIAGSGHADKARGMPAALEIADPEIEVLALGQFEQAPADAGDYDDILLAPAPPRGDPCATLEPAAE